jgi:hypothetical protein
MLDIHHIGLSLGVTTPSRAVDRPEVENEVCHVTAGI